jgi:hypothetical protein
LEPSNDSPDGTELPGPVLMFKQHLVSQAGPTLELKYAVDLARPYFTVKDANVSR